MGEFWLEGTGPVAGSLKPGEKRNAERIVES